MFLLVSTGGLLLVLVVLWDAFETVVLPRRVMRSIGLTRLVYRYTWLAWSAVARHGRAGGWRETYLALYGPLSLIMLLAVWAGALVLGFALLHWGSSGASAASGRTEGFGMMVYFSGTTFFTLGLGDVTADSSLGRILTVVEAGIGFGFLALVISYLPMLYQAFSEREINVSLLDARAGSPPTATELLRRHCGDGDTEALRELLREWERWSAELLESHLSYPVLAYYRSQHEHQSWVAALTAILDTCALLMIGVHGVPPRQAQATFAMARHAAVDLSQVFGTAPHEPDGDRLPQAEGVRLRGLLVRAGAWPPGEQTINEKLGELRHAYEPYVNALAGHLLMPLPPWIPEHEALDDWQTSAWE